MVAHRSGTARNQLTFSCLEELIAPDNRVRVIDAFVDILDFKHLGFAHIQPKKQGIRLIILRFCLKSISKE